MLNVLIWSMLTREELRLIVYIHREAPSLCPLDCPNFSSFVSCSLGSIITHLLNVFHPFMPFSFSTLTSQLCFHLLCYPSVIYFHHSKTTAVFPSLVKYNRKITLSKPTTTCNEMKTVLSLTKLCIFHLLQILGTNLGTLPCILPFSTLLQKALNNFSRKYSISYLNDYTHGKSVALCNLWFLFVWAISSEKWKVEYIKIKLKSICQATNHSI